VFRASADTDDLPRRHLVEACCEIVVDDTPRVTLTSGGADGPELAGVGLERDLEATAGERGDAGLVPAFMPSCQLRLPAVPTVKSWPVLAWNASWKPPPTSAVMLGLVPGFMPSSQLRSSAVPTVHSWCVLDWNAISTTGGGGAVTPLRRIA
jgi:hypothetical protein